jgi:hypothetical protein
MRMCTKAEQTAVELEMKATEMLSDDERGQLIGLLQKMFLPQ